MTTTSTPLLDGRPLVRAWLRTVTTAEFAGFAVPALVGALAADAPAAVVLTVVPAAGAVEGALLGTGQAVVLRRALPGLPLRRWIAVTAAAAVVAYVLGLQPGQPVAATVAIGVAGGLLMAATTAAVTGLALRRLLPGDRRPAVAVRRTDLHRSPVPAPSDRPTVTRPTALRRPS